MHNIKKSLGGMNMYSARSLIEFRKKFDRFPIFVKNEQKFDWKMRVTKSERSASKKCFCTYSNSSTLGY